MRTRPTSASDDSGAVAVVVAICLLALLGVGALAIDLGSAWSTKRNLVTDTDAAALAGALVLQGDCANLGAAADEARAIFRENAADPSIPSAAIGVQPLPDSEDCQALKVTYTGSAQTTFAGIVGRDQLDVLASSTATATTGIDVGGVRPFAVCNDDPLVTHFLDATGKAVPAPSLENREIVLDETWKNSGSCGGAAGNRGWACFDANCGTDVMRMLLEDGYFGLDLGGAGLDDNDCDMSSPDNQDCITKPGATGNSLTNKAGEGLLALLCPSRGAPDCPVFPILVNASWAKKGGRTEMEPAGVLYVRMMGWCINNKSGGPNPPSTCSTNDMTLTIDAIALQTEGIPDGSMLSGPPAARLCANDSTAYSDC